MNAVAKYAIIAGNATSISWRTHPRVEKSNACNASYGERRDDDVRATPPPPNAAHARLSQIETARYEPDWNGPRLTAPFVAQVLGQVLTEGGEKPRSALSAYRGEAKVFSALLCDKRA